MRRGRTPTKRNVRSTAARSDPYCKGHAVHLLKRVQKRRYYKRLQQVVERYRPADEYEKGLIALFREGLQFIGSDTPSIMRYVYDPYDDEGIGDGITVDPDRMIRIVFDPHDLLADNLSEMLNHEIQNCDYLIAPATTLFLTPELTEPFSKDDSPGTLRRMGREFRRIFKRL